MPAQLAVIAGPDSGRVFALPQGEPLIIGRGRDTATRLKDPRVSRVHCQVEADGDLVVITDQGGTGTFVNDQRVERHTLRHGDIVRIGDSQLRFQSHDMEEGSTVAPQPVAPAAKLADLVGKTLARYEVEAVLAKGQTGMIFRARDTKEDNAVALKVLDTKISKDEAGMKRFVRAMKTMLPLRHPNLIAIYRAGKTGPHCWVAMEYVDGESLKQVIARLGVAGMLDWQHALRAAVHVARALDFASQHHIIHRNISPTNIMIQKSDKLAKLGDLMLAKALEGSLAMEITAPGELVGELQYMSPERTRGTSDVDARSDIYALGATVYALLTGRPPFEGPSLYEVISNIRKAVPVKPRKFNMAIPDLFEGAVLRMLEKRPEDRFQTPAELLVDLERIAKLQGLKV